MTKKTLSIVAAGLLAVTAFSVTAPATVQAKEKKTDLEANMVVTRPNSTNQSMVLSLPEVGSIFAKKYANTAIHSVELKTDKLKYFYRVEGYSIGNTYTVDIDIVTGKTSKEKIGGKPKAIIGNIFNVRNVVQPEVAQNTAQLALGDGAVAKGWKLTAKDNAISYRIYMQQAGMESYVTVDAKTGAVTDKSQATPIPPEPEPEPGTPLNKLFGFSRDDGSDDK